MNSQPDLSSRQVIAHNDAADSGNPMHDDTVARRLNFKGALVPGVTVFGYLTHALLDEFGDAWLDEGCAHVRFRQPVYAGETITIARELESRDDTNDVLHVRALNPDGDVCAVASGSAGFDASMVPDLPAGPLPLRAPLPDPLRPAVRESFAADPGLGTLTATFDPADNDAFLSLLQEDHDVFRGGVTHPAWLLRQANLIVDRNFDLGPWIHVASSLANSSRVLNGERIEVRARAVELFERKGHDYADLDVVLLIDGDPDRVAMRVLHRAIYRMGTTR